jgi:hypothetical protein
LMSFLAIVFFVRETPLQRADHPSRGVLVNVVCLRVIVKPKK